MVKKYLMIACTLLIMLFASAGFAANRYETAIATAKTEIPAGAVLYGVDEKEGTVNLSFYDNSTLLSYEVKVSAATNKITEIDIKGSNFAGSTKIAKTSSEIYSLVRAAYPDAKDILIEIENEGNLKYYEVKFATPKFKAAIDVNPVTGAFCKQELKYF